MVKIENQAPVVRRLDNAIRRIITIQWISVNKTNHAIRWIVIYPVDSFIQHSNNPGQNCGKINHPEKGRYLSLNSRNLKEIICTKVTNENL